MISRGFDAPIASRGAELVAFVGRDAIHPGLPLLRTVEKYELLSEIGHGGMATVYRARDTRLDRFVALKVLHPHLRGSNEARVRFTREARSVAKLEHPNVLQVYDYSGEGSEDSYIAAELLTGPTLKAFVTDGPEIPAEIAACIGIQIASALAAAHAKGIVHRDVKPENVLLHEGRLVKLTDFGIAHMIDTQGFTATGQILGSPSHMAPEQVEGGDCDERTDVFALGTVLYFVATGRLPFTGKNPPQILRRVVECEYPDPCRIRPTVGGALGAILSRAMSKNAEDRFPNAAAFEEALTSFLADSGVEDADLCLAEYLASPEEKSAELREQVLPRLIVRGQQAAARGDVPAALESWNRALALDEGNAVVLRGIKNLGRLEGRRKLGRIGARLVLGVGIIGVVGYFAGGIAPGDISVGGDEAGRGQAPDTGPTSSEGALDDPGRAVPGSETASVDPSDPAQTPGAESDAGSERAARSRRPSSEREHSRRSPASTAPRTVVFQPVPQNVAIGIDGSEPRPFGPSFRSVELTPGRHRFRIVAGTDCCEDAEFVVEIPPGDTPYVVSRSLPLNDARLYVVSNVPADVRVEVQGGPPVTGRARELLVVPMSRLEQGASFVVTAPGHSVYTGQVRLRAGQVARTQIVLQPASSDP